MNAEIKPFMLWYNEVNQNMMLRTGFNINQLEAYEINWGELWLNGYTPQEAVDEYIKEAVSNGDWPEHMLKEERLHK